ncbi:MULTISPECIES: alanine dehydrogenase [Bacillaceae]|uniref:Alanine dehydrogenase n=1 Tax=Caldibacillus thermoamylovorans TaxID=35841 RepID=A0A090IXI0_9BACI|nr:MULTISPECIES: alanine dehydrogenase [Bacillaceae]MCB5936015.1 alanine dehydrogenase [Bacillus sp. DFI.2.34]AWI11942.1 alanine dehydrogenase [Caldibacillus thermoamylovorans]KIO61971.1 Alanine dehydrogenase [Caldibacillus thermoamylovorans]KIO68602.1 Alanine dehydrogenase [Caldibacillus thermoamylovorans]MCB7076965.1 alanine dehydrogenase [Caldibacillus thermoamylovorans]
MIIGVPKEIKNNENRVAITPSGVIQLIGAGHTVLIEKNAGEGSSFSNAEYEQAGAKIINSASEVWEKAQMILKVKEPLPSEYPYFRPGLIIFTYLHLANESQLARALIENKVTAIAYETLSVNKTLPLLTPMSEVAGRMAVQIGAQYLEKSEGGKGILLSGIPGVKRGKVTIIGGGVVGTNAAKIALGFGANVTIVDLNSNRLRQLEEIFGTRIQTLISNSYNIADAVKDSDLVIGSVLIPGAKAPKLVTEEMVKTMQPGSVIVDVAIDQGGNFETVDHPTTHDDPIFVKHGVIHYAVSNIPGAVPRTSTIGLTNVTIPYAVEIANKGLVKAITESEAIKSAVNVLNGKVTYEAVARDLGLTYVTVEDALAAGIY